MKITARINTLNEEDNIAAALESVVWADELLVVDAGSSDGTREVARRFTSRVVVHPFVNFGDQHHFADSQCSHEWVLVLDADERLSPELAAAIQELRRRGADADAYRMARRTWYLGRWIRHSGWYPDWKVRLYRRDRARWVGEIHEHAEIAGRVATLQGDILHYTRRHLREHVEVMNRYTGLAAAAGEGGRPISAGRLLLTPPAVFLRSYVWRQGFRDGWPGIVIAYLAAAYVHLKQAKMMERQRLGGGAGGIRPGAGTI